MDHVISADESETIEVAIKTMDWAGEITDLFHYGNKEAIHQAVQGLRTRYNGEFDATILLDQLDQLKTPDTHWAFSYDRGSHLPIRTRLLPLEVLLQNLNNGTTATIGTSDADASDSAPASKHNQDGA